MIGKMCISIILTLGLLFGCVPQGQNFTDSQKAQISETIKSLFAELVADAQRMDHGKVMSYFKEEENVIHYLNMGNTHNFQTLSDFLKEVFSRWERREDESIQLQVLVAATDHAVLAGQSKIKVIFKDGNTELWLYSVTALWKKLDNAWKIIHMHESGTLDTNEN